MASLSQSMASFIQRLDTAHMPPEIVEKARVCLLNACGMGLNSHDTPYAPVARAAALAMDGRAARRRHPPRRRAQDLDRRRVPRQRRPVSRAHAGGHLRRGALRHDPHSAAHRADRTPWLSGRSARPGAGRGI